MQKLNSDNNNTPFSTSLAECNCESLLNNSEGRNSVVVKKTCYNNSEVNLPQHREEQKISVKVYVLNINGFPLMPCSPRKARVLLKGGKANVVKKSPFTIQLNYETTNFKQETTLGIDTGYENVGISVVSKTKELFSGTFKLRTNIKKKISEKSMYRRNKRGRLWHRKSRFLNRGKKGWLPPSIQHRLNSHIRIVEKIKQFLSIDKVIAETANFDIQKINNPDIEGKEYQEGRQKDFENVKSYVLHRDEYKCQHCKKKNIVLNVHHLESRMTGTNNPDNLITLCKKCHEKYHQGEFKLKIKKSKGFKVETFMSIIRRRLLNILDCEETFGYKTKMKRKKLKLEKSHVNDAFCIANGENQNRCLEYNIIQKRRNNRCLQKNRKGFKPSIRRKRYSIQPQDVVKVGNEEYKVKGSQSYGMQVVCENKNEKRINFGIKKIEEVFHRSGILFNLNKERVILNSSLC